METFESKELGLKVAALTVEAAAMQESLIEAYNRSDELGQNLAEKTKEVEELRRQLDTAAKEVEELRRQLDTAALGHRDWERFCSAPWWKRLSSAITKQT